MFSRVMGYIGIIYAIFVLTKGIKAITQSGKFRKDETIQRHGFYEIVAAVLLIILSAISIYFGSSHFFIRL